MAMAPQKLINRNKDAAAELRRDPVSKHQIQPEYGDEQADAGPDCRTVSRDQILRRERGQGNVNFPCSADHEQDWQPYPVDPYSCYMCDHIYLVHTTCKYIRLLLCPCTCWRRALLEPFHSQARNSS